MTQTRLDIDASRLQALYDLLPKETFAATRDAVEHSMLKARKAIVQGQPGTKNRGMRALANRGVFFTVWPRKGKPGDRRESLSDIVGVLYTANEVAAIHETGGTVRGQMAFPIGAGRSGKTNRPKRGYETIQALIARAEQDPDLSLWTVRGSGDTRVVLERRKRKSRGKTRAQRGKSRARKGKRYTVKPVYLITGSVKLQPRLGLRTTWDSQDGFRRQRMSEIPQRILQALQQKRAAHLRKRSA